MRKPKIIILDQHDLGKIVDAQIAIHGNNCDLNHLDVSACTNMWALFQNSKFNRDISQWDVSNVITMENMFVNSKFNGDLTNWKPKNLEYKSNMFQLCSAPQPYWYTAKNTQNAIKLYELNEKLIKELPKKHNKQLTNKI